MVPGKAAAEAVFHARRGFMPNAEALEIVVVSAARTVRETRYSFRKNLDFARFAEKFSVWEVLKKSGTIQEEL